MAYEGELETMQATRDQALVARRGLQAAAQANAKAQGSVWNLFRFWDAKGKKAAQAALDVKASEYQQAMRLVNDRVSDDVVKQETQRAIRESRAAFSQIPQDTLEAQSLERVIDADAPRGARVTPVVPMDDARVVAPSLDAGPDVIAPEVTAPRASAPLPTEFTVSQELRSAHRALYDAASQEGREVALNRPGLDADALRNKRVRLFNSMVDRLVTEFGFNRNAASELATKVTAQAMDYGRSTVLDGARRTDFGMRERASFDAMLEGEVRPMLEARGVLQRRPVAISPEDRTMANGEVRRRVLGIFAEEYDREGLNLETPDEKKLREDRVALDERVDAERRGISERMSTLQQRLNVLERQLNANAADMEALRPDLERVQEGVAAYEDADLPRGLKMQKEALEERVARLEAQRAAINAELESVRTTIQTEIAQSSATRERWVAESAELQERETALEEQRQARVDEVTSKTAARVNAEIGPDVQGVPEYLERLRTDTLSPAEARVPRVDGPRPIQLPEGYGPPAAPPLVEPSPAPAPVEPETPRPAQTAGDAEAQRLAREAAIVRTEAARPINAAARAGLGEVDLRIARASGAATGPRLTGRDLVPVAAAAAGPETSRAPADQPPTPTRYERVVNTHEALYKGAANKVKGAALTQLMTNYENALRGAYRGFEALPETEQARLNTEFHASAERVMAAGKLSETVRGPRKGGLFGGRGEVLTGAARDGVLHRNAVASLEAHLPASFSEQGKESIRGASRTIEARTSEVRLATGESGLPATRSNVPALLEGRPMEGMRGPGGRFLVVGGVLLLATSAAAGGTYVYANRERESGAAAGGPAPVAGGAPKTLNIKGHSARDVAYGEVMTTFKNINGGVLSGVLHNIRAPYTETTFHDLARRAEALRAEGPGKAAEARAYDMAIVVLKEEQRIAQAQRNPQTTTLPSISRPGGDAASRANAYIDSARAVGMLTIKENGQPVDARALATREVFKSLAPDAVDRAKVLELLNGKTASTASYAQIMEQAGEGNANEAAVAIGILNYEQAIKNAQRTSSRMLAMNPEKTVKYINDRYDAAYKAVEAAAAATAAPAAPVTAPAADPAAPTTPPPAAPVAPGPTTRGDGATTPPPATDSTTPPPAAPGGATTPPPATDGATPPPVSTPADSGDRAIGANGFTIRNSSDTLYRIASDPAQADALRIVKETLGAGATDHDAKLALALIMARESGLASVDVFSVGDVIKLPDEAKLRAGAEVIKGGIFANTTVEGENKLSWRGEIKGQTIASIFVGVPVTTTPPPTTDTGAGGDSLPDDAAATGDTSRPAAVPPAGSLFGPLVTNDGRTLTTEQLNAELARLRPTGGEGLAGQDTTGPDGARPAPAPAPAPSVDPNSLFY